MTRSKRSLCKVCQSKSHCEVTLKSCRVHCDGCGELTECYPADEHGSLVERLERVVDGAKLNSPANVTQLVTLGGRREGRAVVAIQLGIDDAFELLEWLKAKESGK